LGSGRDGFERGRIEQGSEQTKGERIGWKPQGGALSIKKREGGRIRTARKNKRGRVLARALH